MARRREDRNNLVVPVRIWGLDASGKAFTQAARTLDITRMGARLADVKCAVSCGDIIGVQHGHEKARFRVAWVGERGTARAGQIGVHCVEPTKFIWGVPLPKAPPQPDIPQRQVVEGGSGRRTHTRYACDGGAEVRTAGGSNATWATTSDISFTGCYLETTCPLPVGTRVELLLQVEGHEVRTPGTVRTSHPSVGMGVAFMAMSAEDRARLEQLILTLQAKTAGHSPAPVAAASASPNVTALAQRLQAAATDLKEVEGLLQSGNPAIDGRVLRDFRTAVDHARQIAWIVQQWLQLAAQHRQPRELLTQLDEEQVRFGVQVENDLATALNDAAITGATRGVPELQHAVAQLDKQLAGVAARQAGPPLAEVAAASR